ncbi:MAG TPA: hypothetical protein PLS93_19670 [Accumulibacter sp.]|nr:hypothetical protein [Accumulibacter sp.]
MRLALRQTIHKWFLYGKATVTAELTVADGDRRTTVPVGGSSADIGPAVRARDGNWRSDHGQPAADWLCG